MTWYLKYRPQTLAELDTKLVREGLIKILSGSHVPHAFLLLGSRGLGKTSTARIIAKSLNCLKKKGAEPCNNCEICKSITAGSCPDVVEIDAASNRGIDDVRELRDRARFAPLEAKVKVYIIDEVHMLTIEAANALLKILEEPPLNTVFVLCTTDPQKLPETVVSRCTQINFSRPTISDLKEKLKMVAKAEKVEISEDELGIIATRAKGSFRDAIKLLEQVALSGQSVGVLLGGDEQNFKKIADAVISGNRDSALSAVDQLVKEEADFRLVVEQCLYVLREKMLSGSKAEIPRMVELIDTLQEVFVQQKTAAVVQLPLEVWIVKNTIQQDGDREPKKVEIEPEVKVESEKKTEKTTTSKVITAKHVDNHSERLAEVVAKWPEILKEVKTVNQSIEALLRSTKPMAFSAGNLKLEVFYAFHKDKLESQKCRDVVEKVLMQVMSENIKLNLVTGTKKEATKSDVSGVVGEDILAAAAEIFKVETL